MKSKTSTMSNFHALIFLLFSLFLKSSVGNQHDRMSLIGQTDLLIIESQYSSVTKHFKINDITYDNLIKIFDDPNHKDLKYFVIDTFHNSKEFDPMKVQIDKAIAPRPWIVIKKFVLIQNSNTHHLMIHHIIFEKYSGILEKDMRILGEGNYPSQVYIILCINLSIFNIMIIQRDSICISVFFILF